MVVDQVHGHSLAVLETEHHAPVAGNTDAPLARTVALQGMQPEARRIGAAWERLTMTMDALGKEAAANGLTESRLKALLAAKG